MRYGDILIFLATLVAGCGGLEPQPVDEVVYLSEAEALKTVFPDAARVVDDRAALSEEERRDVEEILGAHLGESAFKVHVGIRAGGGLDGFALIEEEVGKFKPFRFIVGVEPDGSVRRVAILVYRETRGDEIAHRRFLDQYSGKTAAHPISSNRDIINVSGATMSCNALNHGVKKALAVVEVVYRRQPQRVRRLLETPVTGDPAGQRPIPPWSFPPPAEPVRDARFIMGSICEIQAFGEDRDRVHVREAVFHAFEEIETADRALSDWRRDSEVSRLSREAGREATPVSDLTARFLEEAERMARESGGAFDITVGPLVRAWGFRGGSAGGPRRAPAPGDLEALRPLIGHEKVELARGENGVWHARLAQRGMILDPGGLGKGFAVDLAAKRLAAEGIRSALVNFAGNMYALGAPPGKSAWTIAVRDPSRPDSALGTVKLRDAAISSSGSYEKWVEVDGMRRGHILSPRTLAPVDGVLGAAVIAPTAACADGWSTAAHVLGADAIQLLERSPGAEGIVSVRQDDGSPRFLRTKGWRTE